MNANAKQVGGMHYKTASVEPWDIIKMYDLDYFLGNAVKYILRHKKKGGKVDIEKAVHYLEKWLENCQPNSSENVNSNPAYTNYVIGSSKPVVNHWDLAEVQRQWVDSTMGARARENLHGSI